MYINLSSYSKHFLFRNCLIYNSKKVKSYWHLYLSKYKILQNSDSMKRRILGQIVRLIIVISFGSVVYATIVQTITSLLTSGGLIICILTLVSKAQKVTNGKTLNRTEAVIVMTTTFVLALLLVQFFGLVIQSIIN